jgi:thioredoxin reductase (NADPH)
MQKYDLVIVGAGPAGLGCAISAMKRKLKILLIDKGNIANSIINFPVNMTLSTETLSRVESIEKKEGDFEISYSKSGKKINIISRKVILSTGFYDSANLLNVEGEDLEHVSHYYQDPLKHFNQDVVIVGGKNSAVEAALDLHRTGARVSLVHRRSAVKESVKYWILPDIINRISEQSIIAYLNSQVCKITSEYVEIIKDNEKMKLPAHAVYLLTGYHPDISLLKKIGVHFNKESLVPKTDSKSLESNISGLYLAGSIVAGRNANEIFIENSREHGEIIISDLISKL